MTRSLILTMVNCLRMLGGRSLNSHGSGYLTLQDRGFVFDVMSAHDSCNVSVYIHIWIWICICILYVCMCEYYIQTYLRVYDAIL